MACSPDVEDWKSEKKGQIINSPELSQPVLTELVYYIYDEWEKMYTDLK